MEKRNNNEIEKLIIKYGYDYLPDEYTDYFYIGGCNVLKVTENTGSSLNGECSLYCPNEKDSSEYINLICNFNICLDKNKNIKNMKLITTE